MIANRVDSPRKAFAMQTSFPSCLKAAIDRSGRLAHSVMLLLILHYIKLRAITPTIMIIPLCHRQQTLTWHVPREPLCHNKAP